MVSQKFRIITNPEFDKNTGHGKTLPLRAVTLGDFVKIVGAILFALLFGLIGYTLYDQRLTRIAPQIFGVNAGAASTLQIPKDEFDRAIDESRKKAYALNSRGNLFSIFEEICKWVAIAASALITLVGGFKGGISTAGEKPPNVDLSQIPKRYLRLIAVLASISAISVTLSVPFQSEKEALYQQSSALVDLISDTRIKILEAETLAEQERLLDTLLLEVSR